MYPIWAHRIIWMFSLVMLPVLISGCDDTPVSPGESRSDGFPLNITASPAIENVEPVPSNAQIEWQDAELVMFIHFGMNTFTGREVGDGTENPALFNPGGLDVKQWVTVAREAGFKYLVLTAKHHDGFCLWPSALTGHSVKNSPWKGGRGDVVKEFADECRAQGVKFGYYLSVLDENSPLYGTPDYDRFYKGQTSELCTNYGDVGEIWLDGYLGRNPAITHSQFDWLGFARLTKQLQPKSVMAIMGPDIRWAGNEAGIASETEWSFTWAHPAHHGFGDVEVWWPTECDVSIRPSWFYRDYEDESVKSPEKLVELYLKSVGRNSNLLLNVPPTMEGKFHQNDVASLRGFRNLLNEMFRNDLLLYCSASASSARGGNLSWAPSNAVDGNRNTFWAADSGVRSAELTVELKKPSVVNYFRVEEAIRYGQRVNSFEIRGLINGSWVYLTGGTTIGRSRILKTVMPIEVNAVKLIIKDARGAPAIRTFSAFHYED